MKLLVVGAVLLVAATASSVVPDVFNQVVVTKESMVNMGVKSKEVVVMKLMNQVMQPSMYEDVRMVAKDYVLENNVDNYMKVDVVNSFMTMYTRGYMVPRGEVFVELNKYQVKQAMKVFKLLYFAKDFDVFVRTACWLRERINGGMFVYAMTAAVFHRSDCKGVGLPAPYEVLPNYFVDSNVLYKAVMMKMSKGAMDPVVKKYYGVSVKDNVVYVDFRKGVRYAMSMYDRTSYFTEDIGLNSYYYYLHMSYPYWMSDEIYSVNKERRGEVVAYAYQQLMARYELERYSHGMCQVEPFSVYNAVADEGYWPKVMLPTGDQMPVRYNNVVFDDAEKDKYRFVLQDVEFAFREAVYKGYVMTEDGTTLTLHKPEDFEIVARLLFGGVVSKIHHKNWSQYAYVFNNLIHYSNYNVKKNTFVPTVGDTFMTLLRDPLSWRFVKYFLGFLYNYKNKMPSYTRQELDFQGVKVQQVKVDKLVTYMDDYDVDMTNAVMLDQVEMKKQSPDMVYVARMRRLNHQPFKVTVEVVSDKAVDAVVRVFLGPKYDCMGRLMSWNDVRNVMVEMDSFVYKLETGSNTIVRNSVDMQGVVPDRPMTRNVMKRVVDSVDSVSVHSWWYKYRVGFPSRLMLPMGSVGGVPYQVFVVVSPVRVGLVVPMVDVNVAKERHSCRFSVCMDSMPLGFPFDRPVVEEYFYTKNMKVVDVMVYRKDVAVSNSVRKVDTSELVMMRDDLTYLDSDMMVKRSYRNMMMNVGNVDVV